jgi:ankyrin repeat protein
MQVDVFSTVSPWQYYIYTSLVLMFLIFVGYALLRSRRRVARALGKLIASPLRLLIIFGRAFMRSYEANRQMKAAEIDIEKQQKASADEAAVILKWAASSNNLEAIRSLFESGHNGVKASPQACGAALVAAIQSKHIEASMLIMKQKQCLLYVDENGATPLHWAAKAGYANICHELLAGGIPINARDAAGETPLEWAMSEGEESTINLLLRGDKPLNRAETMNLQSIHFSARMGELDMVKSLFEKTGTLEMRDEKGQTVLFHAVKGRQLKVVKWLLEEGRLQGRRSNVSAVDKEGLTALHVAAQAGDRAIAKLLIERGANVNAESNSLMRPIHMVQGEKGKEMIKLLVQHRAKIDAETKDGTRLIHMAARAGDEGTKILETLVDEGCDIQARAAGGNTAAHLAASCAGTANIAFLVRRSKELLTSRNDMGYTPLMVAAQAGATRVMEYLLDQGASYAVSDNDGRSLVDLTVGWGNHNVMSVLIAHGVKYDTATDNTTWHPIWGAVRDGQGRLTVEQLLGAGVNVDYRWKDMSLLQNALECGNTEAAKCLLEGGASVDAKDKYGWTALHSAAFYGAIEPLLLVLHRATNKAPRDNQGWTPLDLAAFYRHDEAVELLDPDNKVGTYAWARKSSTSEDEDEFTASSAPKDKAETYAWAQEGDSSGHKDDYSRWFRATRGQIFEAPGD